ncbi:hypothetical protein EXU57_22585, partial [Segetibacter sp. 3557_3]|uniref:RHS repeat-associated core domain-containing protein n=1 Tax=Segetibacter sp. 3557_3 TaxID=2547429 RepID=UPI0010D3C15D
IEVYNGEGERTWAAEYDIYGRIRTQLEGKAADCPFRYQGQYEDEETGLYYNRFRYYSPDEGIYLSQDPIGLAGGMQLYGYVKDVNSGVDVWGLSECARVEYINLKNLRWTQRTAGGRGRADVMRASMKVNGYKGDPIDVVETPVGLVTVDHTRAAVALELGITQIPARIHKLSETLPSEMAGRFGNSKTWGDAIAYRASTQTPPLPPTGTTTPPKLPKPVI